MEGPRPPQEAELSQLYGFLDHHLRPKSDWSIKEEYPTALTTKNLGNMRIIKKGDRIVAHAVVHYSVSKTPVGIFKVAAIGSVVTDPEFRKQGLGRQVLEECLRSAHLDGCDFALLWTNFYDFYRKLDFELGGTEISLVVEKEFTPPTLGLRMMSTNKVAPEALLRLYSQHTLGSIRVVDDFKRYLSIPNTRLYTAWDVSNTLKAYAVEGKGADLVGYVHEWGGGVSKLLPLIASIRKEVGKPITVITSSQAGNLIRQLCAFGAVKNQGYLGMIKILSPKNLCLKLMRYAQALGKGDWVIDYRDGIYYIGTPQKMFKTDSERNIIKLVFGPLEADEIQGFDDETAKLMEQFLPIPFWVWGWDSV